MHLFGSHTFSMINAANERVWVKFHFRTQQGIANLTDAEAEALVAKDRESHGRDLFNAIEAGDFPRWTLFIQVMTEAQAKTHRHNPFDLTKVWPKAEYPLIEVGVMELNRWPDNYFAEVEQAAFGPSNVVPGISFSPDRMLQARLFSYDDASAIPPRRQLLPDPGQRAEMPVHELPPRRQDAGRRQSRRHHQLQPEQRRAVGQPARLRRAAAARSKARRPTTTITPTTTTGSSRAILFRLMTPAQQQVLFENTARAMGDARQHIKERHVANCLRADPAYGARRGAGPRAGTAPRCRINGTEAERWGTSRTDGAGTVGARHLSKRGLRRGDARNLFRSAADVHRDGGGGERPPSSSPRPLAPRSSATTSR